MARRLRSRVRGRTVTPPPNVGPEGIHCYLNRIAKTKSNKELVKGQRVSIVTYIDRVNISVTARQMMPALGLTDMQMGQVFSAFVLGYALFQIPGDGWATGGRATREGCGITIGLLDSSNVLGHEVREKKPAGCDLDQIRRDGGQVLSG